MDAFNARRIVKVDRMNDGLIVKFADGSCVFFSSDLLYAKKSEGELLDEVNPAL